MAYDRELADRIRGLIEPAPDIAEQKMFGGLAFLVAGNMAVAASGKGGLMVRVDPAESAGLLESAFVEPMVMGGKELHGWLRVATDAVADDSTLDDWVDRGVSYARSLPAKVPK
jgi:TfoX/Sxy family transcriptional regulator of competence genes